MNAKQKADWTIKEMTELNEGLEQEVSYSKPHDFSLLSMVSLLFLERRSTFASASSFRELVPIPFSSSLTSSYSPATFDVFISMTACVSERKSEAGSQ